MNLLLKPEVLSTLIVFVVLSILLISMAWRDIFKKLGIGNKPQKCLLSLKRKWNNEMYSLEIPMSVLETRLGSTVEELRSRDMSISFVQKDKNSYVIKKSCSKPASWFGYTSLCYVKGDFEGIVMRSFFNKLEFNRFIIEGNYFIYLKKMQENKEFFTTFVECLKKNLTQTEDPLSDEVEIIKVND